MSTSTFTIPSSVTTISSDTFSGCTSITSIIIPSSVTSIQSGAFTDTTSLTSLTFLDPTSLPTLASGLFTSSSQTITIYANPGVNVTSLTTQLTNAGITSDVIDIYTDIQGIIYILNTTTATITSYDSNVTITSITIPTSITVSSTDYTITDISGNAFNGATGLLDVTFLQTPLLPTIGTNAFSNNAANRKIYCYSTITNLSVLTTGSTGINFSDLIIINTSSNINYTLDNGTNRATVYQYNGTPTTITIPSSITVSSVNYNVTSIGDSAFTQCLLLESVTLPDTLTTIGAFAFSSNSGSSNGLISINIPSSVTSIGTSAFQNCSNLATITFLQKSGNLPDFVSASQFNNIANPSTAYYSLGISNPSILGNPGMYFTNIESLYVHCFKEGTKILTDKGYIPIQYLRKGTLVKTLKNGYKPIFMIGKKEIYHVACEERIKDQLYRCSQNEYPELFEDLIITGCHSILVNSFKEEQREKIISTLGNICITEGTYRLPACLDERSVVYETKGKYIIYHFALEHDNYFFNYGVLANGLLVESCSKRYLKEISNMEMIE
jgi:hypothetical protein